MQGGHGLACYCSLLCGFRDLQGSQAVVEGNVEWGSCLQMLQDQGGFLGKQAPTLANLNRLGGIWLDQLSLVALKNQASLAAVDFKTALRLPAAFAFSIDHIGEGAVGKLQLRFAEAGLVAMVEIGSGAIGGKEGSSAIVLVTKRAIATIAPSWT